ncbi:MAG: hypothetical protein N2115_03315, partial [bacterium]|nr:hypothetical protein [bacterium]
EMCIRDRPNTGWLNERYGYIASGVWKCPSCRQIGSGTYGVVYSFSPAVHAWIMGYGGNTKLSRIKRPDKIALILDATGNYTVSPYNRYDDYGSSVLYCPLCTPGYWNYPGPGSDSRSASIRHSGGSNVCFIDGHVEYRNWRDLKTNKDDIFGHFSL